jgi:putative peptide zinc metalloprotease protein
MRPLFSPSWYRVAKLQPRIRNHNEIHRHIYRGEIQYVLQNHSTGDVYRFSPAVYRLIGMMDGRRTVQQIWEKSIAYYGEEAPDQHEVLQLFSKLFAANVLICDVTPDVGQLLLQSREAELSPVQKRVQGNVLFFRIPLTDPEKFLTATMPVANILFSLPFFLLTLMLIAGALVQLWLNWDEFTTDVFLKILSLENIFLLFLIYPVVKGVHELGHGYAVKKWGGEVHEMGVMMLVFMPLPYIDATSSTSFTSKWQRVAVGAAGMYVEVLLAVSALFCWVGFEPGLARTVAYNVIIIGGVSTLLFNGNPLVKFDGYYILSDILEIPNLGQRSLSYLGHLLNRYVLGIQESESIVSSTAEKLLLVVYGLASFFYRIVLAVVIIFAVAGKYLVLGSGLAIFASWSMLVLPVIRKVKIFMTDYSYHRHRQQALFRFFAVVAIPLLLILLVPLPHLSVTEGVVWLPEESYLRSGGDGEIVKIVARPDSNVQGGEALVECRNPLLEARLAVQRSRLREYRLRYHAVLPVDQTEAEIIKEQIAPLEQMIASYSKQLHDMTVISPITGRFVLPHHADMLGRFVKKGELLGYVLSPGDTVRVAVKQQDIDLVRNAGADIELRTLADPAVSWRGGVLREVPGATNTLPSEILGTVGGGAIVSDPEDTKGTGTFEKIFVFDIQLEKSMQSVAVGKRIFVRFNHGPKPLAVRLYRAVRQLFLKRLHV